jgi:hypothetical protein
MKIAKTSLLVKPQVKEIVHARNEQFFLARRGTGLTEEAK